MASGIIDKLHAVTSPHAAAPSTSATRLTYIPPKLDPRTLLDTLVQLGLTIPTRLAAAAANGDLRGSGHFFTIKEVDTALFAANVRVSDRIHLKTTMARNGILER